MEEAQEREIQKLYVKLLHVHRVITLLDSPTKMLEALIKQEIEIFCQNLGRLEKEIHSCRMVQRQAKVLFKFLRKTSYKELRRVQAALKNGIRQESEVNDFFKQNSKSMEHTLDYRFEGIALELKTAAAGKSLDFFPVISTSHSADDEFGKTENGSENKFDQDNDPCSRKALQRRLFYTVMESEREERLEEFLAMPGIKDAEVWKDGDTTALHNVTYSINQDWVVHFITTVMDFFEENENDFPWTAQEFLDGPTEPDGLTALHLAIMQASIPAAKCLIDHGASVFVRDKDGKTPLDLMYERMPEAVLHILAQNGTSFAGHLMDKDLDIMLDLGVLVEPLDPPDCQEQETETNIKTNGVLKLEQHGNGDFTGVVMEEMAELNRDGDHDSSENFDEMPSEIVEPEMGRLASTIYGDSKKTIKPQMLSHVIVKLFLELKWKKLKWPIYFLTLFYIAVYLGFTAIASYVFILEFPYSDNAESRFAEGSKPAHVLWGSDRPVVQGQDEGEGRGLQQVAAIFGIHLGAVTLFSLTMVVYVGLEIWQYFLIKSLARERGSAWAALVSYLRDLENVLQLLFMTGAFAILGALCVGGDPRGPNWTWTYWTSAFTVIIAWILILLQLGNFYGLGKYVHMLEMVFTRFATVMALYLCFLVGFNVAFAIIFPEGEVFAFPKSFFRSFAMMTGELNFDEVFDPEEPVPFKFASMTIYLGFVIIVTIVVGNLLVGLTVGDVAKIFKEADVIHRTIQVERLFIMEELLLLSGLWTRLDIFVLPPRRSRMDGALVCTQISKFPAELQQELRCLLISLDKQEREYFRREK